MANVLLTEKCIRSCPYCFAKKHMEENKEEGILSWKDYIYIIDFLEASNERHVSLLGGEPTLHPHFTDFVIYALERKFHVNVFTSGVMSDSTFQEMNRALSGVHPEQLSFVCNVNHPAKTNFSELENSKRFLKAFGHLTTVGFNIYAPHFDLNFIFDYINQYGLKRFVRLGLAHPIPGKKNSFVAINQMQQMIDGLLSYEPKFTRFRVKAGLDCGYPMCLFSDEQLGAMFRIGGGHITFGCGPALDIGPDMKVWACFPLSGFNKKSLFEFDNLHELHRFFEEKHGMVRSEVGGIFEACDDCNYRVDRLCSGGCLAHILSNFQGEEKIRIKDIYE